MSAGLLFSQMDPAPSDELEFHRWYDQEHIPARMRLPGFDEAVRYAAVQGEPWHLACYHLSDMSALETEAYQQLKAAPGERTDRILGRLKAFTRYICDLRGDTGAVTDSPSRLFVTAFQVPEHAEPEFDGWYDEEHVPLLMKADGWLRVRRYKVRPGSAGPPWTHLALHELRDEQAMESPERAMARDTERRDALAANDWFGRSGRWVYRPIAAASASWKSSQTA